MAHRAETAKQASCHCEPNGGGAWATPSLPLGLHCPLGWPGLEVSSAAWNKISDPRPCFEIEWGPRHRPQQD